MYGLVELWPFQITAFRLVTWAALSVVPHGMMIMQRPSYHLAKSSSSAKEAVWTLQGWKVDQKCSIKHSLAQSICSNIPVVAFCLDGKHVFLLQNVFSAFSFWHLKRRHSFSLMKIYQQYSTALCFNSQCDLSCRT